MLMPHETYEGAKRQPSKQPDTELEEILTIEVISGRNWKGEKYQLLLGGLVIHTFPVATQRGTAENLKEEANQRLNALIEKKVRDAEEYHLDTLKRTENVAEALSDEDWQCLGARKRELEAQLENREGKS